jgi:hypothetical protein
LTAPGGAARRLEIYQRHYRESLRRHILGRFPTVEWLLGSARMLPLVDVFVRTSPPKVPCMAEYGAEFINFLAWDQSTATLPYLEDVATMDWHLGNLAVAISRPAMAISALQVVPQDRLPDLSLTLQPGVRYLASGWPLDDLVRIRLSEAPPDQLTFDCHRVALEISGARGRFGLNRLDPAVFRFRSAICEGLSLGAAMLRALEADAEFDIPNALAAIFSQGLVAAIGDPASGA